MELGVKSKEEIRQELEESLKEHLDELERAVAEGNYPRVYDRIQRAKAVLHVIVAKKLWKGKGNVYFALQEATAKAKEAFNKKDAEELKKTLLQMENILLG